MDISDITDTTRGLLNPLHEGFDQDKVKALANDMAENGWHGAPLVAEGENAFTGSHRIAAVAYALDTLGVEVEIPFVQISDLCETFGIDWDGHLDDHDGDTYEAAAALRGLLPSDVVEYLGYDVDGAL